MRTPHRGARSRPVPLLQNDSNFSLTQRMVSVDSHEVCTFAELVETAWGRKTTRVKIRNVELIEVVFYR